ncbi:L,D-transpeptidase [Reyranella sp. CPCC 100927]|uniref:L,D-transpeptidase family protein n=1 Tax=Reyranella sp. CPCC 100927 TaxID=2599616 RepID=UPI002107726D|nr:L,D-transpeptidase family protein [Reyranella sp. CPCC 100927]
MTDFRVIADPALPSRGRFQIPNLGDRPCALGRGGVHTAKREGDGVTPAGTWRLRRVWYRADRLPGPPQTALALRAIAPSDGWCDDPASPDYNRAVVLPHAARHERLWRDDALYDVIVELGYNDDPPVAGDGSAIFLHVAHTDFAPTEGCVALAREDLLSLLRECGPGDALCVTG